MQISRVEEIIKSTNQIDVEFQNHPVWLEGVYADRKYVRIKLLDTTQLIDVPATDLVEH